MAVWRRGVPVRPHELVVREFEVDYSWKYVAFETNLVAAQIWLILYLP